jgi:pyruvate,water dikinase
MMDSIQREDKRTWYLSLRRSFENLQLLRRKIEDDLIPAMVRDAQQMAGMNLTILSDEELAREIRRRKAIESRWNTIYWEEYIPFAHGVRLFGQLWSNAVRDRTGFCVPLPGLHETAVSGIDRGNVIEPPIDCKENRRWTLIQKLQHPSVLIRVHPWFYDKEEAT